MDKEGSTVVVKEVVSNTDSNSPYKVKLKVELYNVDIQNYKQQMNNDDEMRKLAYKWFSGTSLCGKYMITAYYLLTEGDVVRTVDILAAKRNLTNEEYLKEYPTPTEDEGYIEMKRAVKELTKLFEWKGCRLITEKDKQDGRLHVYTFETDTGNDDPLEEELTYIAKLKLDDYVDFCKNADGFMPDAWFTHFFQRHPILRDKIHRSQEGTLQIQSGANPILKNIDLLPEFFEWIQTKQVVKVTMQPFALPQCEVVIHPHYLKEYNGRWYVYGYGVRDGKDTFPHFSLPLDRIVGKPVVVDNIAYIPAKPGEYDEYFKNIIGVTHGFYNGVEMVEMGMQDIVIRVHSKYMYGLVTTKKFHASQRETLPFGEQPDGRTYGEITLRVEPNNELVGKILQMGTALEVMAPVQLRDKITHDLEVLIGRYK